jgi:hypothetical protein
MNTIEIKTLIDITNTRVARPSQGTKLQLDQNRNFVTLMQCVELRSIVSYEFSPEVEKIELKGLDFGSAYRGKHNVWTFRFSPDRSAAYIDDNGNTVGALLNDLHAVPIIKNLTETINIEKAIFDIHDSQFKNTIIKAIQGNI